MTSTISIQTVQNYIARINNTATYINNVYASLEGKTQPEVDIIINDLYNFATIEFTAIRAEIIVYLRGMYCATIGAITPLQPIYDLLHANISDLGSVISAVESIIAYLAGPYEVLVQTIIDITNAVIQLSQALINVIEVLIPPSIPGITIPPFTVSFSSIDISEITNCPVPQNTTGDFGIGAPPIIIA
jgi:hypothetical protein